MQRGPRFIILFFICSLLFIIPFFWLKPGEMDLGGDTSRLYFYDPFSYLRAQSLYGVIPSGIGGENVGYWAIPYFLLLWLFKTIFVSSTTLINISHGVSLSVAFLSVFFLVREILTLSGKENKKYVDLSAIISGLFYIFTPTLILGWEKEILTHAQFFLNPLMFLLIFRFVTRNDLKYLFLSLIITFVFSPNFSFVASPPFFAFYPIAIVFIILYTKLILQRKIPFKSIGLGLVLFLLLHLFHLGSHLSSLFVGGSQINENVFSAESKFSRGLSYFIGVAPRVKVSYSWMNLAQLYDVIAISYAFIIFPLIVILGFIWNRSKQFLLTGLFFLFTFFFVTANITDIGFNFYQKLFDFPGFSMFRNYFGQWVFVFTFFYMLLFAQALQTIFEKIKQIYAYSIATIITMVLLVNGWPFINGDLLNNIHFQSKNVKIPIEMDPEYEHVLTYIRNLDVDGKFISFPLPDTGYQMIAGKNGGAYQGPSTISYLAGKNDFTGYDGLIPFNDMFLTYVKNNDIEGINRIFSLLNIKYVFYNSDPGIYDDNFPKYPYSFVRDTMPKNQKEYQDFLEKLPIRKVKDFGKNYHIYEVNDYLPHFYTSNKSIYATDAITPYFLLNADEALRSVVFTEKFSFQNNTKVILEAVNNNPLNELTNNYHLHVHEPFISRRPDDIFYPLVVQREESSLSKKQSIPNDYLDFSMLYLSKRVLELAAYRETPITHQPFTEPQIWELHKWRSYYSWESSLSRYENDAKELMTWIKTAPVSEQERNAMYIKLNENFSQHELRLKNIIKNSLYADDEKRYLQSVTRKIFANLFQSLDLKPLDNTQVPYVLEVPQEQFGEFIPYIRANTDTPLVPTQYIMTIQGKTYVPSKDALPSSIIEFESVPITNEQTNIIVKHTPVNLLETDSWVGTGTQQNVQGTTIFQIDNQMGEKSGFSARINNYQPRVQYIITFEYFVEGDDVKFAVSENQVENNKFAKATYFNKLLNSKIWKKQQSILTANPNATGGFVQFLSDDNGYSGKLHIRNMSVTSVPNNTVLFKKVTDNGEKQALPTITFKKVNPTRYKVHVSNAMTPYSLVFSEAYSDNWKVYYNDRLNEKTDIIAAYLNGEVKELKHENIFYKNEYLQNPGTELPSVHLKGNGYANVWNIKPEDVGGKNEYTLDFIYKPQTQFYYFLAVSFITFIIIVGALFYLLIKRK